MITNIDGVDTLSVPDERALLRGKAGAQVLLHVKPASGEPRDVLVTPISATMSAQLRYSEWEYTRRSGRERSKGSIGYVHLRAMGPKTSINGHATSTPSTTARASSSTSATIGGGNIDSWLLSRLLRQAWFYFQTSRRESLVEHAIRFPRPHRRVVRHRDRLGRRSIQ